MAWEIKYGLGGGFGGRRFREWQPSDASTEEEALTDAYEMACAKYDSYAGLHGLRSLDQIIEDEGCDEAEAEGVYTDEREGWLDYEVREVA